MLDISERQFVKHAVTHPFSGFEDLRWKKAGSLKYAFLVTLLLFAARIVSDRLYGFQFVGENDKVFNIIPYFTESFLVLGAWTVGNWAVCTILDGEGTLKNICIYSAYSLIPYTVQLYVNTILSHVLVTDEKVFMELISVIGILWSAVLMFSAVKSVHQYSVKKTVLAVLLTVAAMFIILFLLVLIISLFQQIYYFVRSLWTEIQYRIKV